MTHKFDWSDPKSWAERVPGEREYPVAGFAPGDYICTCQMCERPYMGAKRSWHCEPCAVPLHEKRVADETARIAALEAEYGPYTGRRP